MLRLPMATKHGRGARGNVRMHCYGGSTLIELIVVIAIFAFLVSVLMPVFEQVRKQAKHVGPIAEVIRRSESAGHVVVVGDARPQAHVPVNALRADALQPPGDRLPELDQPRTVAPDIAQIVGLDVTVDELTHSHTNPAKGQLATR